MEDALQPDLKCILGALEYKLLQSQAHMEAKGLAFCTLRQSITDQVLTQGGSIL